MDYPDWEPIYRRIQSEFGYPFDRERRSADRLKELLPSSAPEDPLAVLRPRFQDRTAVVVGLAPSFGAPPVRLLRGGRPDMTVVAADGAAQSCLLGSLVPDVIVTDLDGPVASEVEANARGSFVVVHAHGDNLDALDRWVGEFRGEIAGSWAGPPESFLLDVGGFTDGDRAVLLAEHLGARRILLFAFDFRDVSAEPPAQRARKLGKLRWAKEIVESVGRREKSSLEVLRSDGTTLPYPLPGGPAIQ